MCLLHRGMLSYIYIFFLFSRHFLSQLELRPFDVNFLGLKARWFLKQHYHVKRQCWGDLLEFNAHNTANKPTRKKQSYHASPGKLNVWYILLILFILVGVWTEQLMQVYTRAPYCVVYRPGLRSFICNINYGMNVVLLNIYVLKRQYISQVFVTYENIVILNAFNFDWMNKWNDIYIPFNALLGYIGTATSEGIKWRIVLSDIH